MSTDVTGRPSACLTTVSTIPVASESSCTSARVVGGVGLKLVELLEHHGGGPVDRALDRLGELDGYVLDVGRLAADDDDLARPAVHGLHEAQHALRVHAVRADRLAVLDRLDIRRIGLEHVYVSRLAALLAHVDQDHRVIAAHDLVGEVEATGAEVLDLDTGRDTHLEQPVDYVAPETVVPEPGVADARHQDLLLHVRQLGFGKVGQVGHPGDVFALLAHVATGSTSSAKKKRKRPVSRRSSCPGSSSTVTPR